MKKTEKLLSTLLMIVMFVTSVGLLYASIYASGGGTQSTFGSVIFEKETGIRYNSITKEFEVFNEAGVSWIGSGRYISVEGVVAPSGTATNPEPATYAQADSNQTYNIMRDIAYSGTISGDNIYNTNFDTNKITLGSTGILDGRGFTLKGFKVATITLEGKPVGTALVATNNGTIRNLNMSNASLMGAISGNAAGIICGINKGIIDSCITYGTDSNATYQTNLYTELYGICAISSGKITNSTNNANLNNTKADSVSAGITGVIASASLLNNINNGNITATAHAAGIAIDAGGVVFTVRGNTNNGNLTAQTSVSGIIDGGTELTEMDAKNNRNNGELDCDEIYELYYGVSDAPIEIPTYGIKYNPTLNAESGGFEIYNVDGISWVSSGAFFDEAGNKAANASGGAIEATGESYYEINEDVKQIDYNTKGDDYNSSTNQGVFNTGFYGQSSGGEAPNILAGGVFNGNFCQLINFPIRECGPMVYNATTYSAFFHVNKGTIKKLKMNFDVKVLSDNGHRRVGGMAGQSHNGRFEDCELTGAIIYSYSGMDVQLGGFVNAMSNGGVSFIRCAINLELNARDVGGMLGWHSWFGEYSYWLMESCYIKLLVNPENTWERVSRVGGVAAASARGTSSADCAIEGIINADVKGFAVGVMAFESSGSSPNISTVTDGQGNTLPYYGQMESNPGPSNPDYWP